MRQTEAIIESSPEAIEDRPVRVIELATERNFCRDGYLLVNKDVAAAGVDPWAHFSEHGEREARCQITAAVLTDSEYRRRKFERFASILDDAVKADRFPVVLGASFDLKDYASESANCDFDPFVDEIRANPGRRYLDLGCGLRRNVYENCLYLEVYPCVCADIICEPNCTYPIKDGTLDGIGCFAVLEHTRTPWKVVSEIHRMLKPGGKVFIDWPFLQPVHGYPSHYFNATREGLRTIFEDVGFAVDLVGTQRNQTPDYTVNWVLGKFVHGLPEEKRQQVLRMTVAELIEQPPSRDFWNFILSELPDPLVSEFSCGNTLIATKS